MEQLTCKVLPSGNLLVTANTAMRSSIADGLKDNGYWSTMADAFESYSTNGGFTPFDAGEGNPFVGLSAAPCIAEAMDYRNPDELEVVGRLWVFTSYQVRDPLKELLTCGRTEFELINGES